LAVPYPCPDRTVSGRGCGEAELISLNISSSRSGDPELVLQAMIVETEARLATRTDRTCGASISEPSWRAAYSRREMEQATVQRVPKH
jgi:hypothetical protein